VRDAQGRIRFHGAFTGGFSAGYFNTVGSKEGQIQYNSISFLVHYAYAYGALMP